jgi:hypothetical protein
VALRAADYELDEHELALLREAVRSVDLLDLLDEEFRRAAPIVVNPQGPRAHPAAVEPVSRGGTGTHSPTVGQDRDGASSQAPTRSLPPVVRAQASPARPTDPGNLTMPAARSGQTGRENAAYPTSLPLRADLTSCTNRSVWPVRLPERG